MRNRILESVESDQIRSDLPQVREGYNIKVHVRIKEGTKERIQIFEGLVIAAYGEGINKSIKVDVLRKNKVRRAKLYYMRDLKGKSARLKEIKSPVTSTKTTKK